MNKPFARMLLTHGAGAGISSEFMQDLARALGEQGILVELFNFAYMAEQEATGKKRPPSRMPVLLQELDVAISLLPQDLPLIIGGKSMGGRAATMLLDSCKAAAAIAYGYPFHPPGKPEKLRTDHLQTLQKSLLIIQGERDTFGNATEMANYALSANVQTAILPAADHSFKPPKRSGLTQAQHILQAAQLSAAFLRKQLCI